MRLLAAPGVLEAVNPWWAFEFFRSHGWHAGLVLGAVVLTVTGGEALYADLGHFGRKPVQLAWLGLVLPGLALNYLGQGALLMGDPSAIQNPFYRQFPEAWLLPALVLATLAAIIASQAVISGAYSLTKQAIQLGFLPLFNRAPDQPEQGDTGNVISLWALSPPVCVAQCLLPLPRCFQCHKPS